MEDITLNNKLAAGSQSQVYMGEFEGKDVAVKILSFTVEVVNIEWTEVSILTQLTHRNIVKLHGLCYSKYNLVSKFPPSL